MTGPAKRVEARVLRRKQPHKEENTRPSRKLVQGRQVRRSVSRSPLLSRGTFGNAIRLPCSARIGEREISRTVRGDVSTLQLRPEFFLWDYSFRHERPHFILKYAAIAASCALDATVLLSKDLTKVGNPKVASPKIRRVDEQRLARRDSGPIRRVPTGRRPDHDRLRFSLCLRKPTAS
jgi:hypothetical protein